MIVVARVDVWPGAPIGANDLEVRRITGAYRPADAFDLVEDVVGRVSQQRILAGDPVRKAQLIDVNAGFGALALLAKGERAIEVADPLASSMGAGDLADVWSSMGCTVAQAVRVLRVGPIPPSGVQYWREPVATPPSPVSDVVSLAVTPEQALAIAEARAAGRVWLTLRNPADSSRAPVDCQGVQR